MITSERIAEIEESLSSGGDINRHANGTYCKISTVADCDCIYGIARELLSELKDSISLQDDVTARMNKLNKSLQETLKPRTQHITDEYFATIGGKNLVNSKRWGSFIVDPTDTRKRPSPKTRILSSHEQPRDHTRHPEDTQDPSR